MAALTRGAGEAVVRGRGEGVGHVGRRTVLVLLQGVGRHVCQGEHGQPEEKDSGLGRRVTLGNNNVMLKGADVGVYCDDY